MRIIFYLFIILYLLLFPATSSQAARNALFIWGQSVVPVLFPYMLFCRLFRQSMTGSKLPNLFIAVLLGMLGGSPSGAAAISVYGKHLQYRQRLALSALTGTISPMFLLGAIKNWTKDPRLCSKLLFCHWAGASTTAVIILLLYRRRAEILPSKTHHATTDDHKIDPLSQSIDAILQVGGCIIRYSVLAQIINDILAPFPLIHPLLHAAMEISGGMLSIINSSMSSFFKNILLAASCGFSSFSVISQNHRFLQEIGIKFSHLFLLAVMRMIVSSTLMALLSC